jgi:hypothetical protein
MGYRHRRPFLIGVLCFALLSSTFASAQGVGNAFDRGYREGIQQGEEDGRDGRAPQAERNSVYRDGNRGYQNRYGSRDVYRDEFRRGFISGYQDGYGRYRGNGNSRRVYDGQRDNRRDPRVLRGYQDPAFARGYSDGWDHGAEDRRDRDRYDPVRHGDYRDGDDGYSRSYGSRDAYKNNYRSGFRQGYEEGYRNGTRYRG